MLSSKEVGHIINEDTSCVQCICAVVSMRKEMSAIKFMASAVMELNLSEALNYTQQKTQPIICRQIFLITNHHECWSWYFKFTIYHIVSLLIPNR